MHTGDATRLRLQESALGCGLGCVGVFWDGVIKSSWPSLLFQEVVTKVAWKEEWM